jgi:hypothetical protein
MIIPLMNSLKKMSRNLLILTVIIFCLGSVSCSLKNSSTPNKNSINATVKIQSLDKEEYEIFSELLNQDSSKSIKVFVVLDKTDTSFPFGCKFDKSSFKEKILRKYPTLLEALNNFDERKNEAIPFEKLFNLRKEYKLVSQEYVSSFYKNKNGNDGWEAFQKAHPGCSSVNVFSRVGFDRSKNIAIFYRRTRNSGEGESGGYLLVTKHSGNWKLIDVICGSET